MDTTSYHWKEPFDIAAAPRQLDSEDAPHQQVALRAALRAPIQDENETERFANQEPTTETLEYFRRTYERKYVQMAMQSLLSRHRVDYERSRLVSSPDRNDLAWMLDKHFIDLMVCVGDGLGLDAMIPNRQTLHTYEFTLDIGKPNRQFSTKFAKLGFDPAGCMLWMGTSPNAEDVWMAWAPNDNTDDVPAGHTSGATPMSTGHYRMAVMFLAKLVSSLPYRDVITTKDYPDVADAEDFHHATNLL